DLLEQCQGAIEQRRLRTTVEFAGQYAMNEDGNALADIAADILGRNRRTAERLLHAVRRAPDIHGRVEQRAVEVAQRSAIRPAHATVASWARIASMVAL